MKKFPVDQKIDVNTFTGNIPGSISALDGATPINYVPCGQDKKKKYMSVNETYNLLSKELSSFTAAQNSMFESVENLKNSCLEVPDNAFDKDKPAFKTNIAIGEEIIAAYQAAIETYDDAIRQIKTVNPTFTLKDEAAESLNDTLDALGLDQPKIFQLVGRLQAKRAEAYDEMTLMQGWNDLSRAGLHLVAGNAAAIQLTSLNLAMKAHPSVRTAGQQKMAANEASIRREQTAIYRQANELAVTHFDLGVEKLTSLPINDRLMPDKKSLDHALKQGLRKLLSLRTKAVAQERLPSFQSAHQKFKTAYAQRHAISDGPNSEQEKAAHLSQVLVLAAEAKESGIEAVKYMDQTIDFNDKAWALDVGFTDEEKVNFSTRKKKLQDLETDVLGRLFDVRMVEMNQLMRLVRGAYDKRLMESYSQSLLAVNKLKIIHDDCSDNILTGKPDAGVPDQILHKVLKTLPAKYEDATRQFRYLAKQFEKNGKGFSDNAVIVEHLKDAADSMQTMLRLVNAQLGQVGESAKAGQGTVKEAHEWIRAALMRRFPDKDAVDDNAEELEEQIEAIAIDDLASSVQPTPATVKGPAPSTNESLKKLNKAIKAAENAVNNEQTKQHLEFWEAESRKFSQYARQGAKEEESPHAVEEYMELAAANQEKLATKKSQIAKKFQRALSEMAPTHEKYAAFTNEMKTRTREAEEHHANRDAFIAEGETLRIAMSKELPPTHSLFHYLYEKGQIESVEAPKERKVLGSRDEKGKPRRDPRTGEVIKDYIDEYVIKLAGGKKFVAHFHYKSMDADKRDIAACHFKTWEQRNLGMQYVMREAKEGRDAELHRGRTNLETLDRLEEMAA